jgi:BirA family biotin operon repressor/biotin-[acetyl-CoA-carboxylase] ligase
VVKAAPGRRLDMVPAALALAALDSLRAHAPGVDSWLKWPNDILVGRRKLAGMLCELVSDSGNRPAGMLAGLGVNLNMDAAGLAAVAQPATSLAAEGAEPPRPENFAARLGESIAGKYAAMLSAPGDGLFRRWRDENRLLGQEVEVVTPRGARMSGVFEDLGPDGQMVLRLPGGAAMTLHCGEVSIAKPWPPDRPPTK